MSDDESIMIETWSGRKVDQLADGLTSNSPGIACMARGVAAGFAESTAEWFRSEMARGTPVNGLLHSLASLQIQTFASIAANILTEGADPTIEELYVKLAKEELLAHARMTRAAVAKARGGR